MFLQYMIRSEISPRVMFCATHQMESNESDPKTNSALVFFSLSPPTHSRNLFQLHHVHGGLLRGHHHHDTHHPDNRRAHGFRHVCCHVIDTMVITPMCLAMRVAMYLAIPRVLLNMLPCVLA